MAYEPAGIKVKGYKQAIRALQAIGVPAAEIKAAGSEAGELVANQARSLVPVKSGALRNSIRVSKALNRVSVSAGNNKSVPYANPIHWGWFKRNIKPQPFFIKALGITRDEVYQNYYRSLDKLIASNSTKGMPTE
jgi:HK97 gp10 family phage protein